MIRREVLLETLDSGLRECRGTLERTIGNAITSVVWPPGGSDFTILAESGRGRVQGNGVGPIKREFVESIRNDGWLLEKSLRFADGNIIGRFDAVWPLPGTLFEPTGGRILKVKSGSFAAVEWETGNISSSHRSLNRMALGLVHGGVAAAFLVLPTRKLYAYLTDRIGSFEELAPYFGIYHNLKVSRGLLEVLAVEYDKLSSDASVVRRIPKGTDGRAAQ